MSEISSNKKIDVPPEHWDRLFAPSACLVMITTVDGEGRINAASFGTCVRVCHDPVYIAFTSVRPKIPTIMFWQPKNSSSTYRRMKEKFSRRSAWWVWNFLHR